MNSCWAGRLLDCHREYGSQHAGTVSVCDVTAPPIYQLLLHAWRWSCSSARDLRVAVADTEAFQRVFRIGTGTTQFIANSMSFAKKKKSHLSQQYFTLTAN